MSTKTNSDVKTPTPEQMQELMDRHRPTKADMEATIDERWEKLTRRESPHAFAARQSMEANGLSPEYQAKAAALALYEAYEQMRKTAVEALSNTPYIVHHPTK